MPCFIVFTDYYILQCAGDHLFYEVIEIESNIVLLFCFSKYLQEKKLDSKYRVACRDLLSKCFVMLTCVMEMISNKYRNFNVAF